MPSNGHTGSNLSVPTISYLGSFLIRIILNNCVNSIPECIHPHPHRLTGVAHLKAEVADTWGVN